MRPILVIISNHLNTFYLLRRFAEVSGLYILPTTQSESQPDVVIIDADGADYQSVIEQARMKSQPGEAIPIILCAWLEPTVHQRSIYHLQKPILLKDFQSIIQQAISQQTELGKGD